MLKKNCFLSKFLCVLCVCLSVVLILNACAEDDILIGGDPNSRDRVTDEDYVTFTDALGREVSVKKKPSRTAALLGSFADLWMLAGGEVCAAAQDAWDDFGLELSDAVNLGGAHSPNLELLLSSEPELVLASASTASNVEMKDVLEKAGITVAYFDVDCFDDYLNMLDVATEITCRRDLYEQNGLAIKRSVASVKSKFAQSDLPEEKRTVLLLRASSGFVKAKGSEGTVLGEMLKELGMVNIADSDTALLENLSVESVMERDPYRIFVVTMGDDTEKATARLYQMINENPAWRSLSAVRENRLHIVDRKLFNIKPNAKWDISYDKLCEILLEGE